MRKIQLLAISLFIFSQSFAFQIQQDTIPITKEELIIESNIDANLDSLLNLWYVQQAFDFDTSKIVDVLEEDSIILEFPDSVYIERLSKIPSVVELSYNNIVRNYIHAYTKKRTEQVEVMLGLADYYFPIFDDIFDYYDVPNEMKYMSIIESALNPRALSKARAVGLWQFMYGTGRLYGLTINSYVDERRDPIKSTHAAARFVKDLYRIYGDWILVIAAYNCGPGNVNKAIRRSGGKRNYWDIYYYLPRETRGHVPAFIAATYIMHYYNEHNLKAKPIELPLASDTIVVSDDVHLEQIAEVIDIPLEKIRDMNPQYRLDIVPGKSKSLAIRLPIDKTSAFIDYQDSIFAYKDSIYFNTKKQVVTPQQYTSSYRTPGPPTSNHEKLTYVVKSGDNLGYIADWYDVRLSDIRYWNNINRNLIRAGQKLTIYKPKNVASNYKDIDSMSFAAKQRKEGKTVSQTSTATVELTGDFEYYTVKNGDTLWDIARKFDGVTDSDIMKWNNLGYNDRIVPGQKLKIKSN